MKDNIKNYVDAFFDKFSYSIEAYKAKEKIIETLVFEYNEEKDFEKITKKYNSLDDLVKCAGYSKKDIEKWESNNNVLELDEVKVEFKKERKFIIISAILFIISIGDWINTVSVNILYSIWAIIFTLILVKKIQKHKVNKSKIESCSINAFSFLKEKYDKYSKKLINSIFISFVFLSYFFITSIKSVANSKIYEIIEFLKYNLTIIEIMIAVIIKNVYLSNLLKNIIRDNKINENNKHIKKIFLISSIYWLIVLVIEAILKFEYYTEVFIGAIVIYIIGAIIYTFKLRKNIVYKNIKINKLKLATYMTIAIIVIVYQFMQRDFWLVQPYINTIPNTYEGKVDISYNEENGVYTITNQKDDFKLLQLTDIHLGGSPFSFTKDMKALKTVYNLIDYTKPDFVIVTGDMTFPLGIMSLSLNNSAPVMQFASFMRNLGVPWAFTYGNHDTESMAKYTKEDLNTLYKELSYKTSKTLLYPYTQPEITGRNNQMIELRNSDGSLNQALFLIDSNAYTGEGVNKYDYIRDEQVEWYKQNILDLQEKEKKKISSFVFFHIPLQQYATAYNLYEQNSDEVKYFFGENNEKMINKVCASEYPSKLFDTAVELGSTKGFFCGHDHYNNMSLEYKGIRLTYGMSVDYLAMPGIEKDTEQRGGTLITIHKDSSYNIEQVPYTNIINKNQ